jgi:hypothetical protein
MAGMTAPVLQGRPVGIPLIMEMAGPPIRKLKNGDEGQ